MAEQTECCKHETQYLCACAQGYRSHAMQVEADECDCGKVKIATEPWQSCSGQTHVFHAGAEKCDCRRRFAGIEHV